jgi:hypothetical protein
MTVGVAVAGSGVAVVVAGSGVAVTASTRACSGPGIGVGTAVVVSEAPSGAWPAGALASGSGRVGVIDGPGSGVPSELSVSITLVAVAEAEPVGVGLPAARPYVAPPRGASGDVEWGAGRGGRFVGRKSWFMALNQPIGATAMMSTTASRSPGSRRTRGGWDAMRRLAVTRDSSSRATGLPLVQSSWTEFGLQPADEAPGKHRLGSRVLGGTRGLRKQAALGSVTRTRVGYAPSRGTGQRPLMAEPGTNKAL